MTIVIILFFGFFILFGVAIRGMEDVEYTPEQLQAQREWAAQQDSQRRARQADQRAYDASYERSQQRIEAEAIARTEERKVLNSINETWTI